MTTKPTVEELKALGAAVLAGQHRKGFCEEHDPRVQVRMLPAADDWLAHWTDLLRADPLSAAGPLASLLAGVYEETRKLRETPEGVLLAGWTCPTCSCFNGAAKEWLTECRSCGAKAPGSSVDSEETHE
jgi:hypothetical protein